MACVQAPNIPVVRESDDSSSSAALPRHHNGGEEQQQCGWGNIVTTEMCEAWREFTEDGLVLM